MDDHDREFEALLKQFTLRQPPPFPGKATEVPRRRSHLIRRIMPAAAALVVALIGLMWFSSRDALSATIEIAGDSSYAAGEVIRSGTPIQSGPQQTLIWSLENGLRVEMRPQSNAILELTGESIGLRLNNGSVLVSGLEKPLEKPFSIVTVDTRVDASGGVLLVEVHDGAARVGVVRGNAEVHTGATTKTLQDGQQFTTGGESPADSLAAAIAWSRRASELVAMLPVEPASPASPIVSFTPEPPSRKLTRTAVIPVQQPVQDSPAAPAPQPPAREPEPAPEQKQREDAGAEGPGPQILGRACTLCHNMQIAVSLRAPSREVYSTLIARQRTYGAPISAEESEILAQYLFNTYGVRPNAKD